MAICKMLLTSLRSRPWELIFWAYSLLLTGALLYPLDFYFGAHEPPRRLPGSGIRFTELGLVRSLETPESLYRHLTGGSGLSIEAWLSTAGFDQNGPARIVSYSLDTSVRNFTLAQDGTDLILWLRTSGTNQYRANPELRVANFFTFFRPNSIQHLAVTYDFGSYETFLNGRRVYEEQAPGGRFSNWDPRFHLVLGNEATGTRPWRGTLLLLAIYSRPLSNLEIENNYRAGIRKANAAWFRHARVAEGLAALYLFDETSGSVIADQSGNSPAIDLEAASGGKIWQKPFLAFSAAYFNPRGGAFRDCAINVLIFVPFGFLAYRRLLPAALKTRSFLQAIVLGIVLSASAEVLQHYSLTRQSSLNDISSNAFGSAMGAALAGMYRRARRHQSVAEMLVPDGLR